MEKIEYFFLRQALFLYGEYRLPAKSAYCSMTLGSFLLPLGITGMTLG